MPRSLEIPGRWIAENILCYRLHVKQVYKHAHRVGFAKWPRKGFGPGYVFTVSRSVARRYRAWVRKDGLLNALLFLVRGYKVSFFEESALS